jgi:hypothetical protein
MRRRCPFCKNMVRLKRDGTLYKHGRTFSKREWPTAAYGQNQCPGSNQLPERKE